MTWTALFVCSEGFQRSLRILRHTMDSSAPETQPLEKILLVDDVPANLTVLTAALEPQRYEILAASSGQAALKVAARAQPSLILLDIMMPEMNGLETCRQLKQGVATRDIPVIFITGEKRDGKRCGGISGG